MSKSIFVSDDKNFEVMECETPQDYTEMFSVPCGTCMVADPGSEFVEGQLGWKEMLEEHNIHPAAWYHYTGYSKGVYLYYRKMPEFKYPIARAMLYRAWDQEAKVWKEWSYFGDIKAVSFGARTILAEILDEQLNYLALFRPVSTQHSFEVPGIQSKFFDDLVCPLAHCDANNKDFAIQLDAERGVFKFIPYFELDATVARTKYVPVGQTYDWSGFVTKTAYRAALRKRERKLDKMSGLKLITGDVKNATAVKGATGRRRATAGTKDQEQPME